MSQENGKVVVRQPIHVTSQSRRHFDERVFVRFPLVVAFLARALLRMSPRSSLRRTLVNRAVRLAFEATNREDFNVSFVLHHPDVEMAVFGDMLTLGLESAVHGRQERLDFQTRWHAEWGEFRFQPQELIDLGDRVLVVGRVTGSGLSSGAPVDNDWAVIFTFSRGRVIREEIFTDHAEALEAVGLSE
jgi:ketosteroid isomerase-like protein